MSLRAALCLLALGTPALAVDLELPPGARILSQRLSPGDSYALPIGAFAQGTVPHQMFEGRIDRLTWRIDGGSATTLQLMQPLRAQLQNAGYDVIFECRDADCGGFDFRFATEVVPAPDMHVDIRDFRFVSARRDPTEAISLLVSRSRNAAYVQLIRTGTMDENRRQSTPDQPAPAPKDGPETGLIASLTRDGHAVLADLEFQSGAAALGAGPFASLAPLASYLKETPGITVALVGHTDSKGQLSQNIALSKRRAEAVRARLIQDYGVPSGQLQAEGMGYLAPIASNLTQQGRETNRRVEVILVSLKN